MHHSVTGGIERLKVSPQREQGQRITQATLPFAPRCGKRTAFGVNEGEASASVAVPRIELEEDLGQTAFGVK